MTRFLHLTDPRSGTMMLTDTLTTAHPEIQWYNLYAANPDDPVGHHLNWENHLAGPAKYAGTAMHRVADFWIRSMSPIPPKDFWKQLCSRHDRWILLHRENVLRQYLSIQVGVVLGSYHVAQPRAVDPGPVRIVIQEFLESLEAQVSLQKEIDKHFPLTRLQLTYEQLAEDWSATFRVVQQYLDLPVVDIPPVTCRQETRSLREAIQNYDEIRSYLSNRGYERWFNE